MIKTVFFSIALLLTVFSRAQSVVLVPDTTSIEIGDQLWLTLSVNYRVDQGQDINVEFPDISDTLSKEIEVVQTSDIDTVISDDLLNFTLSKKIKITSYETGRHSIPPFRVQFNDQELSTPEVYLEVRDVAEPIDDIKNIEDIKEPLKDPLTFWEKNKQYVLWFVFSFVWAIVSFVVYKWIMKIKARREANKVETVIIKPAHEKALESLDALQAKSLWQNNQVKAYHSGLSEILRLYLEERFRIKALESTTKEIIQSLQFKGLNSTQLEILRDLLTTSDFVKFAKENPIGSENEAVFESVVQFINETKRLEENA